jgi:hypothetical protein
MVIERCRFHIHAIRPARVSIDVSFARSLASHRSPTNCQGCSPDRQIANPILTLPPLPSYRPFLLLLLLSRPFEFPASPPVALTSHRLSYLDKAGDVAAGDQARELSLLGLDVLLRRLETIREAILHDKLELAVHVLGRPGHALRVLCHFETGHGDATGISGFACRGGEGLARGFLGQRRNGMEGWNG